MQNYDPEYELVIDPLLASTFIGGSGDEEARSIALDSLNNVYITGYTSSLDYPVTPGAFDETFNEGIDDIFISKFNPDISQLLSSTYIGGDGQERGYAMLIDEFSNVIITGSTWSIDFPTTPGAYQETYYLDGEVFISKFNTDLNILLASTFIGGNSIDIGTSMYLSDSNNIFVSGFTYSDDYPVTPGAYDTSQSGDDDFFISKLNNELSALLSSTFIGGNGGEIWSYISLDSSGNVYITGQTSSYNYPVTPGAFNETLNGSDDVCISKFNNDLSILISSTYLGGNGSESGNSIALDNSNNVYITGTTHSIDYPSTPGAYDETPNSSIDVFVSKLNQDMSQLLASTYIGGGNDERGKAILLDDCNNVYITGWTISNNFPVTPDAYDTTYNDDYSWGDVFLSKLNTDLSSLLASTFIGGNHLDDGSYIALDSYNNVLVTGFTQSENYPVTTGAYSQNMNGIRDVFITKIDKDLLTDAPILIAHPVDKAICIGSNTYFRITASLANGFQWQVNEGSGYINMSNSALYNGVFTDSLSINYATSIMNGNMYRCAAINLAETIYSNGALLTVYDSTEVILQPSNIISCEGDLVNFVISSLGYDLTYQWRKDGDIIPGANDSSLVISSVTIENEGSYDCEVSGECGSVVSELASLIVFNNTEIIINPNDTTTCEGEEVSFIVSAIGDSLEYQWRKDGANIVGAVDTILTISSVMPADTGFYDCAATGECGTEMSDAANLSIGYTTIISHPVDTTACEGGEISFIVNASGLNLNYQWRKNDVNIPDMTDSIFLISNTTLFDQGLYDCIVTGDCGTEISNKASHTVYELTEIIVQPVNAAICEGEDISFWVEAIGYDLSYQWLKDSENIPGATDSIIVLSNVTVDNAGLYECLVSGYCGNILSNAANFEVYPTTEILIQPLDTIVCEQENIQLFISPLGQSLTYQWRKDGIEILGENDSTLYFNQISLNDTGNYSCMVTGDCGTALSATATLFVTELIEIEEQPSSVTLYPGEIVTLSVLASGSVESYHWRKDSEVLSDGGNISGAETNELIITNILGEDAGDYDCEVSGDCNMEISETANLLILGIQSNYSGNIKIYPNPTSDIIRINSINNEKIMKVVIFNQTGNKVFSKNIYQLSNQIDLSTYEKGVYLIEVVSGNKVVHSKVILN